MPDAVLYRTTSSPMYWGPSTAPKAGVVYMAWGQKAIAAARASIASLRAVADYPVMVVGDAEATALGDVAEVRTIAVNPFESQVFLAGRVKPILYSLVPEDWKQVLYVDADTTFRNSPAMAFSLLDRGWDFLVAETGNRSLADQICGAAEADYTRKWFGVRDILYHNSGMLAWRQCPQVDQLFALWTSEWLRYGHWDEQVALLRAIARSEAMFLTLPMAWNTNFPSKAALVFHQFGQRVAWKYGRRRGAMLGAPELRKMAQERRAKAIAESRRRGRVNRVRQIEEPSPGAHSIPGQKPGHTPFNLAQRAPRRNLAKVVAPEKKEEKDGKPDV